MITVLLVFHLLIAVALIGVVLVQRSEGGALGIGGGGGGGLMSGRTAGNLLTRVTAALAAVFMLSSLGLAFLHTRERAPASILDERGPATSPAPSQPSTPAEPAVPLAR